MTNNARDSRSIFWKVGAFVARISSIAASVVSPGLFEDDVATHGLLRHPESSLSWSTRSRVGEDILRRRILLWHSTLNGHRMAVVTPCGEAMNTVEEYRVRCPTRRHRPFQYCSRRRQLYAMKNCDKCCNQQREHVYSV